MKSIYNREKCDGGDGGDGDGCRCGRSPLSPARRTPEPRYGLTLTPSFFTQRYHHHHKSSSISDYISRQSSEGGAMEGKRRKMKGKGKGRRRKVTGTRKGRGSGERRGRGRGRNESRVPRRSACLEASAATMSQRNRRHQGRAATMLMMSFMTEVTTYDIFLHIQIENHKESIRKTIGNPLGKP